MLHDIFDRRLQVATLPSGLRLAHLPGENDPRFYLSCYVRVGSRYESPATSGLSHYLEHMMFRGSENYPSFIELSDAFEKLGGEWNAATAHEHTEFTLETSFRVYAEAISLFSEFIQKPLLLNPQKEKNIILREIEDETNEFGHCIDTDFHIAQNFWAPHPMSLHILGKKSSLQKLGKPDLLRHFQTYYVPENMSVIACGGPQDTMEKLLQAFENFKPKPKESFQFSPVVKKSSSKGKQVKWVEHSDHQFSIQISFCLWEGEWSQNAGVLKLLSQILGDGLSAPLPMRIREECQLVYDIQASASLFSDVSTLDVRTSTTAENTNKTCEEIFKVLAQVRKTGIEEAVFQKAQFRFLVELDLLASQWTTLAYRIGWHLLNGQDPALSRVSDELKKLTPARIHEFAQDLFQAKNCSVVLLGPKIEGLTVQIEETLWKHLG